MIAVHLHLRCIEPLTDKRIKRRCDVAIHEDRLQCIAHAGFLRLGVHDDIGSHLLIRTRIDAHRIPVHQVADGQLGIGNQQGFERDTAEQTMLSVDHIQVLERV